MIGTCGLLASAEVSPGLTGLFGLLLVGLILCLAFEEKLHAKKSVIAGSFAVVCLLLGAACGVLPFEEIVVGSHRMTSHEAFHAEYVDHERQEHAIDVPAVAGEDARSDEAHPGPGQKQAAEGAPVESSADGADAAHDHSVEAPDLHVEGHRIVMPVYIPAIDWGVIAIIVGSSLFVDITSKSGLFTWIALKVTKASGGDPLKLLISYGIMTVVFSAVLNNVTAMIIVGSLTAVSLDKLGRNEKLLGFLLVEGLLTNLGGLLTLISSVPNIIVGTAAQISFVEFVFKAAPYVVVATLVTLAMAARLFGIHGLRDEEEKKRGPGARGGV